MGTSLLSLAEGTTTSTHVQPVGVDEAVLLQTRWVPLGGSDRVDVDHVHGVNLFERTALGLNHEEVDDDEEQNQGDSEDKTVQVVDLIGDEGGAEGDDEVEEPVGCGSETHAGSAVAGRVQLSDDGPDKGSPGSGECSNEQAGEDDHDVSSRRCGLGSIAIETVLADEGVDEQTHGHPRSTDHHSLAATDVLNNPETEDCSDNVDGTENDGSDVGVLETGGRENGCSVVEEVVGTSQLLTSLEDHTEQTAVQHAGTGEDLVPWVVTTSSLSLELLLDLGDFSVDESTVGVNTVETGHVGASLIDLALAVCVTGGLGQKQDGATKDDGPKCGETVGDTPLSAVGVVLRCTVVDHVRSPDTECDEQLVRGDGGTTDALGDRFRLVHGDDGGKGSDTETGSQATHGELNPDVLAGDFNNDTSNVEEGRTGDSETTTEGVSKRS